MSDGFNLSSIPGWARWNRSIRISETISRGRHAESILNAAVANDDWPSKELTLLRQLTDQLHECADRGRATWRELQALEHLPDDEQLRRIREICRADPSNHESRYLMEKVEFLETWVRRIQEP